MWTWLSRGTGTARSPRIWFPRAPGRTGGLEDMIISLYAGGMTIRDIAHHLAFTLGTELSHETISKITDEEVAETSLGSAAVSSER
jgi:putative transposase